MRRFTRRSRNRRLAWISAGAVVAILGGLIAIAVYSPLLSLETIEVRGATRVNPEEIHAAVDQQLGTPLAMVDESQIERELSEFSLIRSFVTETIPPHTLVIHISERQPIAAIETASGFDLVDPAGVLIETSDERPAGYPLLSVVDADSAGPVFAAVVEVLGSLPDAVAAQVDSVSATTIDDVTLNLAGGRQRVVWGSAERSELKARVFAALAAAQGPDARLEFDVTSPLSPVVRPG